MFGYDFFNRFYEIEEYDRENAFYSGKIEKIVYKVIVGKFPGRIFKRDSEYVSIDISVMNLIAQLDKSTVRQVEIIPGPNWIAEVAASLDNGTADICVLPGLRIIPLPFVRFINNYDEEAYCALIPRPPRLTFLHFLLTPFDGFTWIFTLAAVASGTFVWQRLTKSFDSALGFLFFVFSGFFGQFVVLNAKRKVLVIILQLFVLMTFILGNIYESMITSTMTASRDGRRLKTFDELFRFTDMTFMTDGAFRSFYDSETALQQRMEDYGDDFHLSKILGKNIALMQTAQTCLQS